MAVPKRRINHVVSITQREGYADDISRAAAHEAIGVADAAANSRAAVAPGDRPPIAVPPRTLDQVVTIAQGRDERARQSPAVADEAIGGRDRAADSRAAVPPCRRPAE